MALGLMTHRVRQPLRKINNIPPNHLREVYLAPLILALDDSLYNSDGKWLTLRIALLGGRHGIVLNKAQLGLLIGRDPDYTLRLARRLERDGFLQREPRRGVARGFIYRVTREFLREPFAKETAPGGAVTPPEALESTRQS